MWMNRWLQEKCLDIYLIFTVLLVLLPWLPGKAIFTPRQQWDDHIILGGKSHMTTTYESKTVHLC